ncbi:nuclear transport factor 2 family protein [Actinacidiphila acididurans]|uniref:Nuclear transport factor 2 family protein n=1 Tax=Actinacidiphila acididurans TaxID=2784346 RepID=A0ABS2TJG2_9ACTN|nr:nuclear transport factor 2 family protein [Actinacidiphila acididurans]MBM9503477.1 nuclear transport factor 2 family protein [Actinacidiphila acididurans]
MNDYGDVINAVHQYFTSADAGDWDTYRKLHADTVHVDFGGVNDDAGGAVPADEMLRSARNVVGPVELTQHMITNEVVSVMGDRATVTFYEQALHHHPALGADPAVNTWVLYARGEHEWTRTPEGWKLTRARLRPVHHTGNADLLGQVAALDG